MTRTATKISKRLALTAFLAAIAFAGAAHAENLRRTISSPHFTVEGSGASVTMTWFAPTPTSVEISRYSGGWNSNPAQTVVYTGPPPPSISLTGGGRTGGGRYTIKAFNAAGKPIPFTVDMVGPANLKNW